MSYQQALAAGNWPLAITQMGATNAQIEAMLRQVQERIPEVLGRENGRISDLTLAVESTKQFSLSCGERNRSIVVSMHGNPGIGGGVMFGVTTYHMRRDVCQRAEHICNNPELFDNDDEDSYCDACDDDWCPNHDQYGESHQLLYTSENPFSATI